MSPELNKAIAERKKLGYSEDKIRQELVEAGYDNQSIDLVLSQVKEGDSESVPLPGVISLINNALDFVMSRYDLALVLAAPLVLLSLMNYLMDAGIISGGLLVAAGVVGLLSLVAYFYLTLAVLYLISHYEDREIIFKEALDWSKRNIFKYAWLAVLSALVVWGGFVLLIIPGLIFTIYLYLSQYVLTIEGKTGFTAMTRSQQLISGAWWPVLSRLAGVSFLFILFFIVLLVVSSLASGSLAESAASLFLTDVLLQLFTGLVTVCSFHIGTQIYRNRAAQVPDKETIKPKSVLYGSLVVAGLLLIFGLAGTFAMFADDIERWSNQATINSEVEQGREAAKQRAEELRNLGTEGE
jgi:hypothetical protein